MNDHFKPREVEIPVEGRLFLSELPGKVSPFTEFLRFIDLFSIDVIICLESSEYISWRVPEYDEKIRKGFKNITFIPYEIRDFGVPSVRMPEFFNFISNISEDLKIGKNVLIHCNGGIGRTGLVSMCLVLCLGADKKSVIRAGSKPETEEQDDFVYQFENFVRKERNENQKRSSR